VTEGDLANDPERPALGHHPQDVFHDAESRP
jgi:hypothetical protein